MDFLQEYAANNATGLLDEATSGGISTQAATAQVSQQAFNANSKQYRAIYGIPYGAGDTNGPGDFEPDIDY